MPATVTKHALYALAGLIVVIAAVASFALFKPRPTRLAMTPRAGDDTVVVNQVRRTRLNASVFDQYRRELRADTTVRYQWLSGDAIRVSPSGEMRCDKRSDAVVRATFQRLAKTFVLRCRPVASIKSASWLDLVVGDSTRDLSFVAQGPDGHPVTELRGTVTVHDASIVSAQGTTVRPKRSGMTFAAIEVGDATAGIPIMVYQLVKSFVDNPGRLGLMAMRVSLAQGDTIEAPLPTASFWVTYFSKDPAAAPPTIELRGNGSCTTGDGLRERRIEDGVYAKYCFAKAGARLMIAHGADGAATVNGVVAIRMMWW